MSVKSESEVEPKPVEGALDAFIQPLITGEDGAPNYELRKFTIKPGGRIPKHLHPEIEHVQYVLKGRYRVGIGEKVYEVKPGDALLIPADTPHWYENPGGEEAAFLCVIPRKEYQTIQLE